MFVLQDGRKWYADFPTAKTIEQMRIQPGEPFQICKTETRRGSQRIVGVEIAAVVIPEPEPKKPARAENAPAGTSQVSGNGRSSNHPNGNTARPSTPVSAPAAIAEPAANIPMNGKGETSAVQMARCYRDAIDISATAVEYAQKVGLVIAPCFEDIRALAATCYIAETRGRMVP